MKIFGKKRFSTWQVVGMLSVVLVGMAAIGFASSLTVPNSFTSGTTISSSEMNANFTAVQTAVNDNNTRINNLVRASYVINSSIDDNFAATTLTPIVNSTVNAPGDGILLIWGNILAEWDLDSSAGSYGDFWTEIHVDGSLASSVSKQQLRDTDPFDANTWSMHVAVPVTAGSHEVELMAKTAFTSGTFMAYIYSKDLMTLFVPFGNDGIVGTLGAVGDTKPSKIKLPGTQRQTY